MQFCVVVAVVGIDRSHCFVAVTGWGGGCIEYVGGKLILTATRLRSITIML